MTLIKAYEINPSLHFEIFMHKIDAVTQDYRNGKCLFLCIDPDRKSLNIGFDNLDLNLYRSLSWLPLPYWVRIVFVLRPPSYTLCKHQRNHRTI